MTLFRTIMPMPKIPGEPASLTALREQSVELSLHSRRLQQQFTELREASKRLRIESMQLRENVRILRKSSFARPANVEFSHPDLQYQTHPTENFVS